MGSFSDYLENKIIDHVFKTASYTVPTNIYVALSTADPLDSGAGIAEPVGNNYARALCNVWDAASGGATANTNAVTFNTASGAWGTISHFAIFDHVSAGNMLAHGSLAVSKAVTTADTPTFAAGDIDVSLT